ncbi:MAG: hypothetical protein VYD37_00385 [Gemmatimonadota bacterium]|nr:hypothetical protein [Gemmatimonadota bacterium]
MLTLFWFVFWALITVLLVTDGFSLLIRLRFRFGKIGPCVDDAAIEEILATGALTTDEDSPLDIEQIDGEERKFWSQTWDEPDEW